MKNKDIEKIENIFNKIINGVSALKDTEISSNVEMNRELSNTDRDAYIKYAADEFLQGKTSINIPSDIKPKITDKEVLKEILNRKLKKLFEIR